MNAVLKRAIAVFSHNEAANITVCLDAIKGQVRPGDRCYVLNNGSTDNTADVVRQYCERNPFCELVEIRLGDKSNAWNVFCHDLDIEADIYVFTDGDCWMSPHALDALERTLVDNPSANAAAGLPAENVSRKNREEMLRNGGLAGNLYALSAQFIERLRNQRVRLPVGVIGDDSLVGALAYWDLDPVNQNWEMTRVVNCPEGSFSYKRLSVFSLADMRLYYRRKIRYSLRHIQTQLMKGPLTTIGVSALPQTIDQLYPASPADLKLTWRGLDTWFDFLAHRRIRERMRRS
jgi:glycosyltransferase involved in cell wall biosynthesis